MRIEHFNEWTELHGDNSAHLTFWGWQEGRRETAAVGERAVALLSNSIPYRDTGTNKGTKCAILGYVAIVQRIAGDTRIHDQFPHFPPARAACIFGQS